MSFHNLDRAVAVAIQPDGKIVAAGHTGTGGGVEFMIARFNANGTPDDTFGFFGFNVLDFAGGPDYAQSVALAPDGKIVVAGAVSNGTRYVFGVARFTTDGVADVSFGLDGKQFFEFVVGPPHWASAVGVQPDHKIVVGGHVNYDFALVRFHPSGAVDLGFGPNGNGTSVVDMGGQDFLSALEIADGGWIYAAGGRVVGGNEDFALAQFLNDGVLATCPGLPCHNWPTGKAFANWGGNEAAFAIDWRSDFQVVAAGSVGDGIGWAQFSTRNVFNPILGTTDFVGSGDAARAVAFAGSSRIVAAATQTFNGDANFALAAFETSPGPPVDAGDSEPETSASLGFRLHAVAPNPVVARGLVRFDLAQARSVRLRVFDVAGRVTRTLVDGALAAGPHRRIWDGNDDDGRAVAAGIYFLRLDAGPLHTQQKVVVVR
jgi:uncharacterized delta-60 repeat protein